MVRVKYYIPEDGDDFEHPNLFTLNKERGVTVRDLREGFPVPGVYHFRVLQVLGSTKVWMDAMDDAEEIPLYDRCVFAKVSRIRYPDGPNAERMMRRGANGVSAGVASATAASSSSSSTSSSSSSSSTTRPSPAVESPENLVDFADFDNAPPSGSGHATNVVDTIESPLAASAAAGGGSPGGGGGLGLGTASVNPQKVGNQSMGSLDGIGSSGSEGDLLGFDSAPSTQPTSTTPTPAVNVDLFGLGGLQAPGSMPMMNNGMAPPMGGPMGPMGGMNAPMGGAGAGAGVPPRPMMGAMGGGNNNQSRGGVQQQQQRPMSYGQKDAFSDLWKK